MDKHPIGVFDSGMGGLSLLRELQSLLPHEDFIYISDNAFAPYGALTAADILDRSEKLTNWLIKKSSKLIVVACNTATTNAIDALRQTHPIPFVGIEPAIKPAALQTKTGVVGVLATKGTLSSKLFHQTSSVYGQGITIVEKEGKHLVKMIEEGKINSDEIKNLLQTYLQPMIEQGIDHLVLGCTHYPFLTPVLKKILPKNIQIVDCNGSVAKQVERVLEKRKMQSISEDKGSTAYFCTGDSQTMRQFVLSEEIKALSIP